MGKIERGRERKEVKERERDRQKSDPVRKRER